MSEIERLTEDDAERAGEMLAKAFFSDPLASYMLPDADERRRLLPWHFATLVRYGALFGEVYATCDSLDGVAVWLPPGETEMTPERIAAAGMDQASAVLGERPWERFMGVTEFVESLHATDMPDEHWYLAVIGVDPKAAGKGVGSALLQPALELADAQGKPCYLETAEATNKSFYEKHGFVVVRNGVEPASGIGYWTFRRDPRSERSAEER
jgi:ribosomal protein S18 acetylase RimI-like enzyme